MIIKTFYLLEAIKPELQTQRAPLQHKTKKSYYSLNLLLRVFIPDRFDYLLSYISAIFEPKYRL